MYFEFCRGTSYSTASFLQDLRLSVACAANTVVAPLMKIQALDWLLQLLMNQDTSKFHESYMLLL